MRARTIAAIALALLLGGSAAMAAAPAKTYPTGAFAIAGRPIAPAHVLDARAIPDLAGRPAVMVTLDAATAALLAGSAAGLPVTLDGKPLGETPASALADSHVVQVSGDFGGYDGAAAIARRISGRDPLPETESDE